MTSYHIYLSDYQMRNAVRGFNVSAMQLSLKHMEMPISPRRQQLSLTQDITQAINAIATLQNTAIDPSDW